MLAEAAGALDRVGGRRGDGDRRADFTAEAGQQMLHRLELADRTLEGDALLGILDRDVEHCFEGARHLAGADRGAHLAERVLVDAVGRVLDLQRRDTVEGHGVFRLIGERAAFLDGAALPVDQGDDRILAAMRDDGDMPGIARERHLRGRARQLGVLAEFDAADAAHGGHRHGPRG